jgi:hypothetical protein
MLDRRDPVVASPVSEMLDRRDQLPHMRIERSCRPMQISGTLADHADVPRGGDDFVDSGLCARTVLHCQRGSQTATRRSSAGGFREAERAPSPKSERYHKAGCCGPSAAPTQFDFALRATRPVYDQGSICFECRTLSHFRMVSRPVPRQAHRPLLLGVFIVKVLDRAHQVPLAVERQCRPRTSGVENLDCDPRRQR